MNNTKQKFKLSPHILSYITIFSFIYITMMLMILRYNISIRIDTFNVLAQIGVYLPLLGAVSGLLWVILVRKQKIGQAKKVFMICITVILSLSFLVVFYIASSIWR